MNRHYSYETALPAPQVQGRAHRPMVVLLAVITGLLLVLGVMGWWFLAGINARYSHVVAETATSLNQLHEVGLHSFTGYGNLMQLRQAQDPTTRAALLHIILEERASNDRVFEKLGRSLTDPELRKCLQDVIAKRGVCRAEANAFMEETADKASTVPNTDRSMKLLRDTLAYQQACDMLTDRIETASLRACQDMAAEIKNLRVLFLVVGALPIVAAVGFLVLTLGLLQVVRIDGGEEEE